VLRLLPPVWSLDLSPFAWSSCCRALRSPGRGVAFVAAVFMPFGFHAFCCRGSGSMLAGALYGHRLGALDFVFVGASLGAHRGTFCWVEHLVARLDPPAAAGLSEAAGDEAGREPGGLFKLVLLTFGSPPGVSLQPAQPRLWADSEVSLRDLIA